MLEEQMWFEPEEALLIAWRQALDEGKPVAADREEMEAVRALPRYSQEKKKRAMALLDRWEASEVQPGFAYWEPDSLEEIQRARPENGPLFCKAPISCEKVLAAWTLRAAGCLLGQPVEGWMRERIRGLLAETRNLPVKGYLSSEIPQSVREKYGVEDDRQVYGGTKVNWINNTDGMPEDDDTNYTILALKLMEQKGYAFTPDDVGECWLGNLPILHVCTAERAAYINMVNGWNPPQSAQYHNAYREYIGAQIRGDFFGYVCPGNPELAAKLAWRDASVSHVKNGIYGEMLVAAMLAQAAVTADMEIILEAGLAQIPKRSRLTGAIREVMDWRKEGKTAEWVQDTIHSRFQESFGYDWCHVIPNAMIVCAGLLYGEGDFTKTMDFCLCAAFDTDCNCATAGSVIGMACGITEADRCWVEPLKDKIRSGVDGMGITAISKLAQRTCRVYEEGVR